MIFGEFDSQRKEAEKQSAATIRYALRQIGNDVAKVAKTVAPVYKGSTNKKGRHYIDHRAEMESGNLKKSIHNAKKLDRIGDTFYLKTAPIGKKTKTMNSTVVRYKNATRGNTLESIKAARESSGAAGSRTTKATRKRPAHKGDSSGGAIRGVQLYRSKIEERAHFMEAGRSVAENTATGVTQRAFDKAFERFR